MRLSFDEITSCVRRDIDVRAYDSGYKRVSSIMYAIEGL